MIPIKGYGALPVSRSKRSVRRAIVAALCLLVSGLAVCTAGDSSFDSLFQLGNQHYTAGDFSLAKDAYQTLIKQGCNDPAVLYNLGNSFLKTGDIGRAMVNYRRAARIRPGDMDIRANLELARTLVSKPIEDETATGLFHGVLIAAETFGAPALTGFVGFLWLVLFGLLIAGIVARRKRLRRRFFRGVWAAAVVCIIMMTLLGTLIVDREFTRHAVAVGDPVIARSGPGEHFTDVYEQQPGYEMVVRREQSGWMEVMLPNGYTGWVPRNTVEIL